MTALGEKLGKLLATVRRVFTPPGDAEADAFIAAGNATLDRMAALGYDAESIDTVCGLLSDEIPDGPPVADAGPGMAAAASALVEVVPPAMRVATVEAMRRVPGDNRPVVTWLRNLAFGRSVIPAGVTAETVGRLLSVMLSGAEVESASVTCENCGLERPVVKRGSYLKPVKPELFQKCPHCGCVRWNWTHLR